MGSNKSAKLWATNVASFILLLILCTTGVINWLLPKGYAAKGSFLVSVRHFFMGIHEVAAILFLMVIAIHVLLHWSYVRSNLKRSRTSK